MNCSVGGKRGVSKMKDQVFMLWPLCGQRCTQAHIPICWLSVSLSLFSSSLFLFLAFYLKVRTRRKQQTSDKNVCLLFVSIHFCSWPVELRPIFALSVILLLLLPNMVFFVSFSSSCCGTYWDLSFCLQRSLLSRTSPLGPGQARTTI